MNESRDLFTGGGEANVPLAERLRPKSVADMVGQEHLLGEGRALWVALRAGKPHSMILWGPPGVGKTTLARLMAHAFNAEFIAISAVLSGVKEIRDAVERARLARDQYGRATILFVDEVHRFNKAQQDAFLPHVESGLLTFIGATTENPSFEVIGALLSRAQVYVLGSLKPEELDQVIGRGFEAEKVDATAEARKRIAEFADGDARRALNLVEQVAQAARVDGKRGADVDFVNTVAQRSGRRFDKGGENYYDQISALHKSVRGSDPDASLYWLPRYAGRRARPRRMRHLPRGRREIQRGLHRLRCCARLHRRGWHAPGAAAHPQRADQAHEEPGLRQGLPLRARRARGIRRGRGLPPRRHGPPGVVPADRSRARSENPREAAALARARYERQEEAGIARIPFLFARSRGRHSREKRIP